MSIFFFSTEKRNLVNWKVMRITFEIRKKERMVGEVGHPFLEIFSPWKTSRSVIKPSEAG